MKKVTAKQILDELIYYYDDSSKITNDLITRIETAVKEADVKEGYLTEILERVLGKDNEDIYAICKNIAKVYNL